MQKSEKIVKLFAPFWELVYKGTLMKKKKYYPNEGDGLFFFHKKTGHPALQISHTDKTWSNRRYTHHPNRLKDYESDPTLSTEDNPVYLTKKIFTDSIYTRGHLFNMKSYKKKR